MPFQMHFERRRIDPYNYAFLHVKSMPTTVLDFWHKSPNGEPFVSGNVAMERFKKAYEPAMAAFERALGVIAAEYARTRFDFIVPLIKSRGTIATLDSPVGRLATAASRRLGIPVSVDIFRQNPRRRLHGGEVLNYDQRYEIVFENLRVEGNQRRTRVLLVDDVVSSGATTSAYRDRLAEAGGEARAVLAVMKYAQEQALLNPTIYRALAR